MGRGPSLSGEENSLNAKESVKVFHSDLLPLELKWSCICAGKEMWLTQDERVMRDPGCFVSEQVYSIWLLWCCGGSTVFKLREISGVSSLVGWIVVVVVMGVLGRVGCVSLLLVKSLSIASHFEPSSAVVSQVVSLVRSLV